MRRSLRRLVIASRPSRRRATRIPRFEFRHDLDFRDRTTADQAVAAIAAVPPPSRRAPRSGGEVRRCDGRRAAVRTRSAPRTAPRSPPDAAPAGSTMPPRCSTAQAASPSAVAWTPSLSSSQLPHLQDFQVHGHTAEPCNCAYRTVGTRAHESGTGRTSLTPSLCHRASASELGTELTAPDRAGTEFGPSPASTGP